MPRQASSTAATAKPLNTWLKKRCSHVAMNRTSSIVRIM